MAFNFERQALAFAQIHHTGVFAWAHQDARPTGGKARQQGPAVAVAAVLGPHHPEHAQLRPVGGSAQAPTDLVVVGLAEVFLLEGLRNRVLRSSNHERGIESNQSGRAADRAPRH